jgi:acyl-CoA synthetase (AMP-forming)/AMP-acid ligase II
MAVDPQTISAVIAGWATRAGETLAILPADESPPVSYGALHARASALAARLRAAGVGRGDAVAFLAGTDPASVMTALAAMYAGVALPLPRALPVEDLAALLRRLRPRLLVGDEQTAPLAQVSGLPLLRVGRITGGAAQRDDDPPLPPGEEPGPDDLALILHSSGTTGRPRGIPRTHRQLLAAATGYAAWTGRPGLARVLVTTPPAFGMGANPLCATLAAGGSVVLAGAAPGAILAAIARWQPTWTYIVPSLLESVLHEAAAAPPDAFRSRLEIAVAGMAAAPELAARAETVLGAPVREGYGAGEAGLIAGASRGGQGGPGTFDRIFATAVATVDADGVVTSTDVPGEIVVAGPQVAAGYLADAEATAAAFLPDGWFRTGDLGVLDASGHLHLTGRVKEIINRGGEKLAPAEIEAALLRHPAVAAAAAFSLPDPRLGEEVAAAVVLRPGTAASERELRRAAARLLAPAKVPRRIWTVAALPRTASGKPLRDALRQRFANDG